jgi:hypothetical protein
MIESERFEFDNVEPKYAASNEVSRATRRPSKAGIVATDVKCKDCGNDWRARDHGHGRFHAGLGGYIFECPACGRQDDVPGSLFR